jgi:DNA end-binding protein Ku
MKSVWEGSIAFGLVNIPVKLYSAVQPRDIGFKLIDAKTKTPIQYKRWCPVCNEEVPWKDVVKGLEIKRGEYYIFTKEELERLKPEKSSTIEIVEFIDSARIDSVYFDKHYYCAPASESEKAFFLFKDVLLLTAKVAVGRFVMREKEHVCAIESYKNGLLLTTLNYAEEVRDIGELKELKNAPKMDAKELELAKKLVAMLSENEFEIGKFKDTFSEDIKKALKSKEKIELEVKEKTAKETKEKDLMASLKMSLEKK